jgi:hypothetical protein
MKSHKIISIISWSENNVYEQHNSKKVKLLLCLTN